MTGSLDAMPEWMEIKFIQRVQVWQVKTKKVIIRVIGWFTLNASSKGVPVMAGTLKKSHTGQCRKYSVHKTQFW